MNSENTPPPDPGQDKSAVIKVFGIGGGGCNALAQMIAAELDGVEFKCVNTDAQALEKFNPEHVIELGTELTKGLGAGANPEVGRTAAEESADAIAAAIGDADMLFLTAGMGGGTGTGAVPVVAKIARELGVLTVAVVTEPFSFEGNKRRKVAEAGLAELRDNADSMIVVPNENLMAFLGPDVTLIEAFAAANDVVTNAVQSIAELITASGLINVDFADVRAVMTEMGHAIMSTGTGIGEDRARDAATTAIESPLLNNVDLKAAKGILANITSSSDLSMGEFQEVGNIIRTIAADDATVVVGTVFDDEMGHEMKVTVVATGLKPPENKPARASSNVVVPRTPRSSVSTPEPSAAKIAEESLKEPLEEPLKESVEEPKVTPTSQFEFSTPPAQQVASEVQSDQQPEAAPATSLMPKSTDAKTTSAVDVCVVCGEGDGEHKPKCPWAKKTLGIAGDGVDSATQAVNTDEMHDDEVSTESDNTKSKSLAVGVAAAVVALAGASYFMFGGNDDAAEAQQAENNLTPKTESPSDRYRTVAPYKIQEVELDTEVTVNDDE